MIIFYANRAETEAKKAEIILQHQDVWDKKEEDDKDSADNDQSDHAGESPQVKDLEDVQQPGGGNVIPKVPDEVKPSIQSLKGGAEVDIEEKQKG